MQMEANDESTNPEKGTCSPCSIPPKNASLKAHKAVMRNCVFERVIFTYIYSTKQKQLPDH